MIPCSCNQAHGMAARGSRSCAEDWLEIKPSRYQDAVGSFSMSAVFGSNGDFSACFYKVDDSTIRNSKSSSTWYTRHIGPPVRPRPLQGFKPKVGPHIADLGSIQPAPENDGYEVSAFLIAFRPSFPCIYR